MRELNLEDTFLISALIDKMGIDLDLNDLMDKAQKEPKKQAYYGGQMMLLFIKHWHRAKDEAIEFIASITEKTIEETKALKFTEIKKILEDLFKDEQFKGFFNMAVDAQK